MNISWSSQPVLSLLLLCYLYSHVVEGSLGTKSLVPWEPVCPQGRPQSPLSCPPRCSSLPVEGGCPKFYLGEKKLEIGNWANLNICKKVHDNTLLGADYQLGESSSHMSWWDSQSNHWSQVSWAWTVFSSKKWSGTYVYRFSFNQINHLP